MRIKRDKDLLYKNEILERLESIDRQRELLCSTKPRSHHISAFEKKQAKIAKLTERESILRQRLRQFQPQLTDKQRIVRHTVRQIISYDYDMMFINKLVNLFN
jgi:hypothetical protein